MRAFLDLNGTAVGDGRLRDGRNVWRIDVDVLRLGRVGYFRLGLGIDEGLVRKHVAEGVEALEFLDGVAVEALGLGLVAEK